MRGDPLVQGSEMLTRYNRNWNTDMAYVEQPEERSERNQGEEPGIRSEIHGHQVMTTVHDQGPRSYLRGLDADEARPIFNDAKFHGPTQFEIHRTGHERENYSMERKVGKYWVTDQGRQRSPNTLR